MAESTPASSAAVGEARTFMIAARAKQNLTDLAVAPGETYHIGATGTWCDTRRRCCTASGYESDTWVLRAAERRRRVPDAPWFALIAGVENDPASFKAVGASATFEVPSAGRLILFANDVSFMYFNNSGAVSVTVARTR